MKKTILIALLFSSIGINGQKITALVGGTLVDGFGGIPIQNSIIIIHDKRILAVGRQGELVIHLQMLK